MELVNCNLWVYKMEQWFKNVNRLPDFSLRSSQLQSCSMVRILRPAGFAIGYPGASRLHIRIALRFPGRAA